MFRVNIKDISKKYGVLDSIYYISGLYKLNKTKYLYFEYNNYDNITSVIITQKELKDYNKFEVKSIYDLINLSNYNELLYLKRILINRQNNIIRIGKYPKTISSNVLFYDYDNYLEILDVNPIINSITDIINDYNKNKITILDKDYILNQIRHNIKDSKKCYNYFKKLIKNGQ